MRKCMGRELVCRDLWMDHISVCDLCTETLYMHNNFLVEFYMTLLLTLARACAAKGYIPTDYNIL